MYHIKGNKVLHIAVYNNNIQMIKNLIKIGIDINATNSEGNTPLHLAVCDIKKIKIVKLLLDNGADISIANHNGYTPLDFVDNTKTLDILMAKGANFIAFKKETLEF